MRLLLDTHVWIWSLLEPERLNHPARDVLSDRDAVLWVSPISAWETLMLIERERLRVRGDPATVVEQMLSRGPFREAVLTHAVALESRRVALEHRDPADRFLVATANVYDLTLMTSDARLLEAEACPVWDSGG